MAPAGSLCTGRFTQPDRRTFFADLCIEPKRTLKTVFSSAMRDATKILRWVRYDSGFKLYITIFTHELPWKDRYIERSLVFSNSTKRSYHLERKSSQIIDKRYASFREPVAEQGSIWKWRVYAFIRFQQPPPLLCYYKRAKAAIYCCIGSESEPQVVLVIQNIE